TSPMTRISNPNRWPFVVFSLCLCVASLNVSRASAQAPEVLKEKTTAEKFQEATAEVTDRKKEIQETRDQLQQQKGTAAEEALHKQLEEQRGRYRLSLENLTALVTEGPADAPEVKGGRALLSQLLDEDAQRIRQETKEKADQILKLGETMQHGSE